MGRMLVKEEKKAEVVIQWVKVHIIKSINNGVLSVPPPVLTRVFQELDVSMGVYHEAERFSQVPFPFPHAATLDLLMILHTLITPFVMISFFRHPHIPAHSPLRCSYLRDVERAFAPCRV